MPGQLISVYANILHLRFTDAFAKLPASTLNKISPQNILARIIRIFLLGVRDFLNLFLPLKNKEDLHGKIWLYVVSKNNYESLLFLKRKLPQAVFVAGQNKQIGIYNRQVNRLSTRLKIFYLFKFPYLLTGLIKEKGKAAVRFFDLIFQATGYYELSIRHLKKYKPAAIIFANDHNTDPRALLLAAKKLAIKTIYLQHASVSESFPPLQFDLNLLEGQDSLDKYKACGPIPGMVKLIGMPKADGYLSQKNRNPGIKNIGVTTNIIDNLEAIQELIKALFQNFPDLNISFRPHPGDRRNFSFIQENYSGVHFSDSKTEPAFEFLKKQDALIAADSSIHLEATMLNILSIYYRFGPSDFADDYYGYVKNNLIPRANNINVLTRIIQDNLSTRPQVFYKAQYYNAVIGTDKEGKSQELATEFILNFLNGSNS